MKLLKCIAGTIIGYILGALLTYFAMSLFSKNTHDLELESVMTAAFLGGPFAAFISLIFGIMRFK